MADAMTRARQRIYSLLLSGVLLVGSVVMYGAFVQPEYRDALVLRGMWESKQRAFENQRRAIDQVKVLLAQSQNNIALEQAVSMALPAEEALSAVVHQINAIGSANGLLVQQLGIKQLALRPSTAPVAVAKKVGTLQVELRLVGSYGAIKGFVGDIESNIRIMDVADVRLEQAGTETQDVYTYDVVVNAYYQSEE